MKQIVDYVQAFVTIALLLAGIGGVAYHMFKEGGWFGTVLGKVWTANLENPVIAIPVTIAVVFFIKMWHDHNRAKGHTSKLPDIMVYIVMAAGVYFLWQFFAHGTF